MRKRTDVKTWVVISVFLVALAAPATAAGRTIYVDDDATGANNGSSWADAYNDLQDALAVAQYDETEIRVAQGVYKPDRGAGITPLDREATFQLINGVTIRGGYAGFGQLNPNARDIDAYETTLSGDLVGNDVDVNDPCDLWLETTRSENSFHVVTGSRTNVTAVLDGFTITAGNANRAYSRRGGGVYCHYGSPTLKNCIIKRNSTWRAGNGGGLYNKFSHPRLINCTFAENASNGDGGGMYNFESSPILTNCTFRDNYALYTGGGIFNLGNAKLDYCVFINNSAHSRGGGGMNNYSSDPTLTNCTFIGNSAVCGGGLSNNPSSNPTLTNCIFIGNLATYGGGGVSNQWNSSPYLSNCTFSGNSAGNGGGGMYNCNDSNATSANCIFSGNSAGKCGGGMCNYGDEESVMVTLINCTFVENSAPSGNGIACDSPWGPPNPSNLEVINCILWDGGDEIWNNDNSMITITYSDVPDGWTGEGNIDADPCFVQPGYWADANDPNIVVEPSNPWDVWIDGDYHLMEDSPCIDAGDPNYVAGQGETDHDGKPRVISGRIDMGAYEYSPPIPAEARIVPRTINLASKGKWITCYIWLPEDYNVARIYPGSVVLEFLEKEIEAESFRVDEERQVAMARFSHSDVQDILNIGQVELTISGQLMDGTVFEATDEIRIMDKGSQK